MDLSLLQVSLNWRNQEEIENCYIINADARDPYFLEKQFDIILSERVIINILFEKSKSRRL